MSTADPTNLDLLAWFSEDERRPCAYCGANACVSLTEALAYFCLDCGAITLDGRRVDTGGRAAA